MRLKLNNEIINGIVGKIGNLIYIKKIGNEHIARAQYVDKKESAKQKAWRDKYNKVDMSWKNLSERDKDEWRKLPWEKGQTGYSKYMRVNLKRISQGYELLRLPLKQNQKGV